MNETAVTPFQTLRNRDARATIRGYVYQVDLTIERWLALNDGDVLELERGEDIDLVSQAIQTHDEGERDRLLEQVKNREARISLRTPEALEALASFVEHREANATLRLRFRFTTTAEVACEQPAIFARSTPAIQVWMQLYHNELAPDEATRARQQILGFLRNQNKPDKLNAGTWQRFISFLSKATDAQFAAIVYTFEWSMHQPSATTLANHVTAMLLKLDLASSRQVAETIYSRLFLHVFRLLSTRGAKVLTRKALVEQLAMPPLSGDMTAMLSRLEALHQHLEVQVASHEIALQRHSNDIAELQECVFSSDKVRTAIVFAPPIPSIQAPPLVRDASRREHTVDSLNRAIGPSTWIAVHGPSGMGKTQLAVLLVQKIGQFRAWIRLNSTSEEPYANLLALERSLEAASCVAPTRARNKWYDAVCAHFGEGAIIVVDDLPRLLPNSALTESMILLCQSCRSHHVQMLTTSPHLDPPLLSETLGQDVVLSVQAPLLSDDEAADILLAHGAPADILDPQKVKFINAVCQQHPSLVVAAAQFLRQSRWQLAEEEFNALLSSKHTASLNQLTFKRILDTVADAASRDLLERLTLILRRFRNDEVMVVAQATPVVERPFDKLDPLLGLWVQYDANSTYLVSPLAKSLGPISLSETLSRDINVALGNSILRRNHIDQYQANDALLYFSRAQEWDVAGQVLLSALLGMPEQGTIDGAGGLLSLWSDIPLPIGMNLGLRIMIRGKQVSLLNRQKRSIMFLIHDLETLIKSASDREQLPVLMASINVAVALAGKDPAGACDSLRRAFALLHVISVPENIAQSLAEHEMTSLIWAVAIGIRTPDQISRWLDAMSHMPTTLLAKASTSTLADIGCLAVADGIWLTEAEKPEAARQWPSVRSHLANLASSAQQLGQELLWACAIRSQMVILGEYENALDAAVSLGQQALRDAKDHRSRFLIQDCIARQLVYKKRNADAIPWFAAALAEPVQAFPLIRVRSLAHASTALGDTQREQALQYLQEALATGVEHEEVPRTYLVKVAGELCILQGLACDLISAYKALDMAVANLIAEKDDTANWKGLFLLTGHVSGYFTTIARTGHPPDLTVEDQPYMVPFRGMLLRDNESECATLYDESKYSGIFVQLAQFADAVGMSDGAEHWAFRGMEAARSTDSAIAVEVLSLQVVPLLILSNRLPDALSLAVEASALTFAGMKAAKQGMRLMKQGLDPEALLGPKPNDAWNDAEATSIMVGLFPVTCRLATEYQDSPERAKTLAEDIIPVCRQLSLTGSYTELWQQAATIIERSFVIGTLAGALYDLSRGLSDEKYGWLRAVALVGATTQRDCSLADACRSHLALMPTVFERLRQLSKMTYDRVVLPWICRFWQRAFEQQRFRFSSPGLTETDLAEAIEADEAGRAQRVLQVVSRSLGIRVDSRLHDWLRLGAR